MPDEPGDALDLATLDSLVDSVGGDVEFLTELIDTFVGDAPLQLEAMHTGLAVRDVAQLVRPAHTLKSASASLGALGLAERCRQLELSAKTGSLDDAAQAIDGIAVELERVVIALERTKRSYAA